MSISHCIDNYIPNVLQYAEMYDIAGLIAPRALFVESGFEAGHSFYGAGAFEFLRQVL